MDSWDYAEFAIGCGALQKPHEFRELVRDVMELHPKVIVEIGVCRGGTFRVWQDIVGPTGLVIGIDLPNGEYGGGIPPGLADWLKRKENTRILLGDSKSAEIFAEVKSILGPRSIDFLFIDGDHTYEGVSSDYQRYSTLMDFGCSKIAIHDICTHPAEANCHVDKFWSELKAGAYGYRQIISEPTNWGGIGVVSW